MPFQHRDHTLLHGFVEVDHHVATEDGVEALTEIRNLEQVQLLELHGLPDVRLHADGSRLRADALSKYRAGRRSGAAAPCPWNTHPRGLGERFRREIGREHLHPSGVHRAGIQDRHHDRVGFFARRAGRAPDLQRPSDRRTPARDDGVAQEGEVLRLTIEARVVGRNRIEQQTELATGFDPSARPSGTR
jgi:hypothetical protein